jgi:Zn-dependent oligopeptidase
MEEVTKEGIVKSIQSHQKQLSDILEGLDKLDSTDDKRTNRIIVQNIMFTMYEFIDSIVNTENDIYSFLKRRE